jgi:hypothetical protein
MKHIILALALAALCVPAFAQDGENPTAKVFITFNENTTDNASVVNRADPADFTAFSAWIGVTDLGMGMTSMSFKMSVTEGTSSPPSYVNLLPGDLAIGNWSTGITVASTGCEDPPISIFGRLDCFYLGSPGDIMIEDHPDYPRWITDCNDPALINFFCIWTHGGVGKDALPGDAECEANVPVQAESWSAIKALYQ